MIVKYRYKSNENILVEIKTGWKDESNGDNKIGE
jgi:hypothetical protein